MTYLTLTEKQKQLKLKTCPFCGSTPILKDDPLMTIRLECPNENCGIETKEYQEYSKLITFWNTRVCS